MLLNANTNKQIEHTTEMFNASGAKLFALEAMISKREKIYEERIAKRDKMAYAKRKVRELLERKTKENQMRRLYDSPMSNQAKMAIFGDEYHLRQELDNNFPINFRDSTVSTP
jgi:hypothetical protein